MSINQSNQSTEMNPEMNPDMREMMELAHKNCKRSITDTYHMFTNRGKYE